jgi:hypothetical protein
LGAKKQPIVQIAFAKAFDLICGKVEILDLRFVPSGSFAQKRHDPFVKHQGTAIVELGANAGEGLGFSQDHWKNVRAEI